jgi:hypothetical protein
MVDRFTTTVLGSILVATGIGIALLSGKHARRHADYLRSGRTRPRPYRIFPYDSPENEGFLRWSTLIGGIFVALVGLMWIARVGTG